MPDANEDIQNLRRGHRRSTFLATKDYSGIQAQDQSKTHSPTPKPQTPAAEGADGAAGDKEGELGAREQRMQQRLKQRHQPAQSAGQTLGLQDGGAPIGDVGSSRRDAMNLNTLMELKKAFDAADSDGSGALDEQEFVEAFRSVKSLQAQTDEQLVHLFMKIDANSDGTVDWDEFTNHILLEQARQMATDEDSGVEGELYVRTGIIENRVGPPPKPKASVTGVEDGKPGAFGKQGIDPASAHHADMIEKAVYIPGVNVYTSAGRDGMIWVWNAANMHPHRMIRNGSGWITDVAYMPNQPVAVTSVDRTISFYDSGRTSLEPLARINNLDNVPMCAHWLRISDCDMLLWGDDHGHINSYSFDDEWGSEHIVPGAGIEIGNKRLPGMKPHPAFKCHNDWVTKVRYLNHSGCLLSSSMDSTLRMVDLEKKKPKWTVDEHLRGVYSFDFCRSYNFIASCGVERHILMWNPFTGRSVGALHGHSASVQEVLLNEDENQLISLSTDKVIKVWDIRSHKCLQTMTDMNTYWPENRISALFYNNKKRCILTCGTRIEPWNRVSRENVGTSPICAVLYNSNFRQVVAGDVDCTVSVWSIDRGESVFSFGNTHGEDASGMKTEAKMSAMCFDNTSRRLVTGAQDGTVKMWNFNNGQCLKEYEGFGNAEVSCVTYLEEGPNRFVAAAGWNRKVCIWVDNPSGFKEQMHHSMEGHTDDIICMTFCPPLILATGGYDGKVILWKIDGVIKATLTPPDHDRKNMDDKPIERIIYMPRNHKTLAAYGVDGTVNIWRLTDNALIYSLKTGHNGFGTAMCTDDDNQHLITADTHGFVKVWDLSGCNFKLHTEGSVGQHAYMHGWKAHHQGVNSVSHVEKDDESFVVTGSMDGSVRFWTMRGCWIGTFGQEMLWQIGDTTTYEEDTPNYFDGPLHPDIAEANKAKEAKAKEGEEEAEAVGGEDDEVDYEALLLEQQRNALLAPRSRKHATPKAMTFSTTLERRLPLQTLKPVESPAAVVKSLGLSDRDQGISISTSPPSPTARGGGGGGGGKKKW